MAKHKIQWHPLFARLLRPRVEKYYELQIDVPVGDMPRHADLVLLRRRRAEPAPFTGLWRWLTEWNVLEYKGPTVAPRPRDLLLLVELGLGIDRRLNVGRRKRGASPLPESEVSFWYLANRLGPRFLEEAEHRLGSLTGSDGLWRANVLGFPCLWKEMETMAKSSRRSMDFDIRPVVEYMGVKKAIDQIGEETLIRSLSKKKMVEQLDVDDIVANLSPSKRQKLTERLAGKPGQTGKNK